MTADSGLTPAAEVAKLRAMHTLSTVRKVSLTGSSFASMFLLGVGLAVIGAAAPAIGLRAAQVSVLLTVQNAGFVASILLFGYLCDIRSKTRILALATTIVAVTYFSLYRSPSFLLNAFIMMGIGIGLGGIEAVTDPMLFEMHTRRRALAISVNHLFVTLGSLIITVYLMFLQLDWRRSMEQAAVAAAVLAVIFALSYGAPREHSRRLTPRERLGVVGREPKVAIMFTAMVCGYGMQVATIGLIPTFLIDYRGFEPVPANLALAIFIGGIAVGRILIASLTREDRMIRNLRLLFAGATVCMALIYFVDMGMFVYPLLFVSGLMISSLLPLIVTYTGLALPESTGTAIAAVKVAIPAGGLVIPFIMSIVAEAASEPVSFVIPALAGIAGSLLLALQRQRLSAPATAEPR